MSNFQDNFKRDEEEDMLEYDDSAFYYFSISVLTFILIPYTWHLVSKVLFGEIHIDNQLKNCACRGCEKLRATKEQEVRRTVYTKSFYFKLIVGAFLYYLWYLNFEKVSTMDALQSFDPFAILGIDNDATDKEIKKQYRRRSLELHPDKNPDNPLAVQEFIKLTKAYNVSPFFLNVLDFDR